MSTEFNDINDIVAENASLHQQLEVQKIIHSGVNKELMRLSEMNTTLRYIISRIIIQNNNEYRIFREALLDNGHSNVEIELEVDPITNDWLLKFKKINANQKGS